MLVGRLGLEEVKDGAHAEEDDAHCHVGDEVAKFGIQVAFAKPVHLRPVWERRNQAQQPREPVCEAVRCVKVWW